MSERAPQVDPMIDVVNQMATEHLEAQRREHVGQMVDVTNPQSIQEYGVVRGNLAKVDSMDEDRYSKHVDARTKKLSTPASDEAVQKLIDARSGESFKGSKLNYDAFTKALEGKNVTHDKLLVLKQAALQPKEGMPYGDLGKAAAIDQFMAKRRNDQMRRRAQANIKGSPYYKSAEKSAEPEVAETPEAPKRRPMPGTQLDPQSDSKPVTVLTEATTTPIPEQLQTQPSTEAGEEPIVSSRNVYFRDGKYTTVKPEGAAKRMTLAEAERQFGRPVWGRSQEQNEGQDDGGTSSAENQVSDEQQRDEMAEAPTTELPSLDSPIDEEVAPEEPAETTAHEDEHESEPEAVSHEERQALRERTRRKGLLKGLGRGALQRFRDAGYYLPDNYGEAGYQAPSVRARVKNVGKPHEDSLVAGARTHHRDELIRQHRAGVIARLRHDEGLDFVVRDDPQSKRLNKRAYERRIDRLAAEEMKDWSPDTDVPLDRTEYTPKYGKKIEEAPARDRDHDEAKTKPKKRASGIAHRVKRVRTRGQSELSRQQREESRRARAEQDRQSRELTRDII